MSEVLEQLELTIGSLGKDRSAERLHNLLDGDILVGELISGGAGLGLARLSWHCRVMAEELGADVPYETKGAHANRLEVGVSVASVRMRKGDGGTFDVECVPRRYFKRRSENLRANEFGHCEGQPKIRGLNVIVGKTSKAVRGAG